MEQGGSKRPRPTEGEDEEQQQHPVLNGPFMHMYVCRYLGLLDRHHLSIVNRDLYGTLTLRDDSLHMMRGLWANWRFIRPDDRLQIICKSTNVECVRFMWERRIPPMPRQPNGSILTHNVTKDAALSGSAEVVKFFLSKTAADDLPRIIDLAMRGFCRGSHDVQAASLFHNAGSSWYPNQHNPYAEHDRRLAIVIISAHADMRQLQAAVLSTVHNPPALISIWFRVLVLCIAARPAVPRSVVDYQWSIVPFDIKSTLRRQLASFCNDDGRDGPHTEYFKATYLV